MDLIIKPTEKCNFKCTFCSSTKIADDHTSELDLDRIYQFIDRFPETNTIIVNGGDPLMMDPSYYWKIIEYLDKVDSHATISLTTNLWPFVVKPEKWVDLFNHPRVGVCTSFQYGKGRLMGDGKVFTEADFWKASDTMLEHCGYRPDFIAVITEENEWSAIRTVELAKEMDVVCKLNYAMSSGDQDKPYRLSKIYEKYIEIWEAGLASWEFNTMQMMKRLQGEPTVCPQNRGCDAGIRTIQPEGDYYTCGAFGDDRDMAIDWEREMNGEFLTPLMNSLELSSLKQACYTCPMFEICNGCKKTIKDLKNHNMVEDHCYHMKQLAPKILEANAVEREVTPYINEYIRYESIN